ncbi:MAG: hypothetical protein ABH885_08320 [Candidatus Omnitrophota bacterium]
MGRKKRTEIKYKHKEKRKKRRARLVKKGLDPNKCFSDGVYLGFPKE